MREVIALTWGWDVAWQQRDFDRRFETYVASVIELEEQAVGGLFLDFTAGAVDIVELQVLPEHQGKGIGSSIVERIVADAAGEGRIITLSVVAANPRARQLYERIGFRVTGIEAPFIRMRYASNRYE